jgi:hypothetical protein
MTTSAFVGAQCPAGPKQSACRRVARDSLATVVLVRAAPGAAGSAALARHISEHSQLTTLPDEPTVLVNFGESVNFPLLLAVALSVFGAAVSALLAARSQPARLLKAE